MSSAAVGTQSGAGPLSLMSCVRESSPLQDFEPLPDNEKTGVNKKRFWNVRKWFKRSKHQKHSDDVAIHVEITDKDGFRSRSTSELSITEEKTRRRGSMHPGLSVSHDSVFHSPTSGSDIDAAQSSSSLSISQPQIELRLQTELSERLRLRRGRGDTSEDDEGLPHSPCNSPTTTDGLLEKTAIKDLPAKSHSTCSDGSLLSMESSEMDEESFSQQPSRQSSKLSLHDKKVTESDSDLEMGAATATAPLNHSAAHHRVSVRPKRRAPHRNNRVPSSQLSNALPATPEVNEDSGRSVTPEKRFKETHTEHSHTSTKLTETQLKCSSLPPGIAAPGSDTSKLSRSRSNAGGSKSQDPLEEDEREEKTDKSFFERIFSRSSAKKKKSKEEKITSYITTLQNTTTVQSEPRRSDPKPIPAPRGAAARQRIQPIDLPEFEVAPEQGTSPLQAELENRFKQRLSASPPHSPMNFESSVIHTQIFSSKQHVEVRRETRNEEIRSKMKIPGLSSLQQKVLSLSDEVDDASGFKSLTNLQDDENLAAKITKSHSFKTAKPAVELRKNHAEIEQIRSKAASLDSVKHLDGSRQFLEEEIKNSEKSEGSEIVISGPSHTAIVNVNTAADSRIEKSVTTETTREVSIKESLSVTKIQLKKETVTFPEFFSKQLNKVEARTSSSIIFSTNSPTKEEPPKTVAPFVVPEPEVILPVRKFSTEDLEIVDKTDAPKISVTSLQITQPRFRKNEGRKKSTDSPTKETSRSVSLDSLKIDTESSDKSSQDSLEMLDESPRDGVKLRRKSQVTKRNDEEPELMKVFARRSLKLKDTDTIAQQVDSLLEADAKHRDSDKENQESPQEERKKIVVEKHIKLTSENHQREPLVEPKPEIIAKELKVDSSVEVLLRKTNNNNIANYQYQRTFSLNEPKMDEQIRKQASFNERRRTDNWIKNGDDLLERKMSHDEIITEISPKSNIVEEYRTESKNFNQRKAEWEKRAKEAQKKSVP